MLKFNIRSCPIVYKVPLLSVKSAIVHSYYQAKLNSGGGVNNLGNETYTVVFEACKKRVSECRFRYIPQEVFF